MTDLEQLLHSTLLRLGPCTIVRIHTAIDPGDRIARSTIVGALNRLRQIAAVAKDSKTWSALDISGTTLDERAMLQVQRIHRALRDIPTAVFVAGPNITTQRTRFEDALVGYFDSSADLGSIVRAVLTTRASVRSPDRKPPSAEIRGVAA